MSIHSSLRKSGAMVRHRNVLTRIERLAKLEHDKRWTQGDDSILGLPKVRSIKVAVRKKKKAAETEAETVTSAEPPA